MGGTVRVLLIEDDEDDFVFTRDLLKKVHGTPFQLDWKPSYEEGLASIERAEHAVCLVDFQLGARTGLDLIREAVRKRVKTPFILLTGKGDREVDFESMRLGASDYLEKSRLTSDGLERAIRYALDRSGIVARLDTHARQQAAIAELG